MASEPKNNYIKILEHLKPYVGNGKFYKIDEVLPDATKEERKNIAEDLLKWEYVDKKPGTGQFSGFRRSFASFGDLADVRRPPSQKRIFIDHELKINPNGLEYLEKTSSEKVPQFNISNNVNSPFVINSPNSSINVIQNQLEIIGIIQQIISTLNAEKATNAAILDTTFKMFDELLEQAKSGSMNQNLLNRALSMGDNISSIAGFLLSLSQAIISSLPK